MSSCRLFCNRLKSVCFYRKNRLKMSGKVMKKRLRKVITLKTKLDILRRCEAGERVVDIGRSLGLSESTIKTIKLRDGPKIKEVAKSATVSDAKNITRTRDFLLVKMESLLTVWIENQTKDTALLSKKAIQEKAKSLYDDLQKKYMPTEIKKDNLNEKAQKFVASNGWFERFKVRSNFNNIKLKGEADSADIAAAAEFAKNLKAIINDRGYSSKQVFNVDQTSLFWKRLPSRTYISKIEKIAPGHKTSKNRVTLLLGGNAEGDFKFKPFLIYQSENPSAMKDLNLTDLPLHWRLNKKAWMTSTLFSDWVSNCAVPEIRTYCSKENMDFKALIVINNAPSHPFYTDIVSEHLKFIFIPPNTAPLIQPINQGVISNFKSYYLRRTFKQLLNSIDRPDENRIPEFWEKFDIMDAINNIFASWKEVQPSCMNGVWQKIWPDCVHKNNISEVDDTTTVCEEIVNLAKEFEIEGMEKADVNELILAQDEDMTNDDLMELDFELAYEEKPPESRLPRKSKQLSAKRIRKVLRENEDEDEDENEDITNDDLMELDLELAHEDKPVEKKLTAKRISKAMALIDEAISIFTEDDPNETRSKKVTKSIIKSISCYKDIYMEQTNTTLQQTLQKYLKPPYSESSSNSGPVITLDSDSYKHLIITIDD